MDKKEIRARRKALGLTQAAFAERLGISDRYMRNLEAGDRRASGILQRLIEIETSG